MHKPLLVSNAPDLTITYVTKGFWGYITPLEVNCSPCSPVADCEEIAQGGEINLMQEIINRAVFIEDEWQTRFANGDYHFAGVWEYEVSEVFGEDLAKYVIEHKRLPDEAWCRTKATELAMAMAEE